MPSLESTTTVSFTLKWLSLLNWGCDILSKNSVFFASRLQGMTSYGKHRKIRKEI